MLKIGEFSKLSRISVRTLRHYDEIGLLKPDAIDPYTDYRYYQEKQLVVAERIKTLREMDFSLSDITEMLKISECASKMEEYFLKRREELVREGNLVTHRLKLLDASLNRLRKDETMNVTLKTIPARHAATLTMTLPAYEDVSTLWRVMMEETAPLHIPDREKSLFAVTYLDGEYREKDILMEASFTVKGSYPDTAPMSFSAISPK